MAKQENYLTLVLKLKDELTTDLDKKIRNLNKKIATLKENPDSKGNKAKLDNAIVDRVTTRVFKNSEAVQKFGNALSSLQPLLKQHQENIKAITALNRNLERQHKVTATSFSQNVGKMSSLDAKLKNKQIEDEKRLTRAKKVELRERLNAEYASRKALLEARVRLGSDESFTHKGKTYSGLDRGSYKASLQELSAWRQGRSAQISRASEGRLSVLSERQSILKDHLSVLKKIESNTSKMMQDSRRLLDKQRSKAYERSASYLESSRAKYWNAQSNALSGLEKRLEKAIISAEGKKPQALRRSLNSFGAEYSELKGKGFSSAIVEARMQNLLGRLDASITKQNEALAQQSRQGLYSQRARESLTAQRQATKVDTALQRQRSRAYDKSYNEFERISRSLESLKNNFNAISGARGLSAIAGSGTRDGLLQRIERLERSGFRFETNNLKSLANELKERYNAKPLSNSGNMGRTANNAGLMQYFPQQRRMGEGYFQSIVGSGLRSIASLSGGMGKAGIVLGGLALATAGVMVAFRGLQPIIAEATKNMVEFSSSLARFQAYIQPSDPSVTGYVKQLALNAGYTSTFTPSQIMEGATELGKLGFDTKEEMAKTLPTIMRMSQYAGWNPEESSLMMGKILNQFGKTVNHAERFGDIIAKTASLSAASVESFREASRYAGSMASLAGTTFEEFATLVAIMADTGVDRTQAGTATRRLFTELTNQNSDAMKAIKAYAKEKNIDESNFKTIEQKLNILSSIRQNLSKEVAPYAITKWFKMWGAPGGEAVLNKIATYEEKQDPNKIKERTSEKKTFEFYMDQLKSNTDGYLARASEKMVDNLEGDWKRVINRINAIAVQFYNENEPVIRGAIKSLGDAVYTTVNNIVPAFTGLLRAITPVTQGLGLLATAIGEITGITLLGKGLSAYEKSNKVRYGVGGMMVNAGNLQDFNKSYANIAENLGSRGLITNATENYEAITALRSKAVSQGIAREVFTGKGYSADPQKIKALEMFAEAISKNSDWKKAGGANLDRMQSSLNVLTSRDFLQRWREVNQGNSLIGREHLSSEEQKIANPQYKQANDLSQLIQSLQYDRERSAKVLSESYKNNSAIQTFTKAVKQGDFDNIPDTLIKRLLKEANPSLIKDEGKLIQEFKKVMDNPTTALSRISFQLQGQGFYTQSMTKTLQEYARLVQNQEAQQMIGTAFSFADMTQSIDALKPYMDDLRNKIKQGLPVSQTDIDSLRNYDALTTGDSSMFGYPVSKKVPEKEKVWNGKDKLPDPNAGKGAGFVAPKFVRRISAEKNSLYVDLLNKSTDELVKSQMKRLEIERQLKNNGLDLIDQFENKFLASLSEAGGSFGSFADDLIKLNTQAFASKGQGGVGRLLEQMAYAEFYSTEENLRKTQEVFTGKDGVKSFDIKTYGPEIAEASKDLKDLQQVFDNFLNTSEFFGLDRKALEAQVEQARKNVTEQMKGSDQVLPNYDRNKFASGDVSAREIDEMTRSLVNNQRTFSNAIITSALELKQMSSILKEINSMKLETTSLSITNEGGMSDFLGKLLFGDYRRSNKAFQDSVGTTDNQYVNRRFGSNMVGGATIADFFKGSSLRNAETARRVQLDEITKKYNPWLASSYVDTDGVTKEGEFSKLAKFKTTLNSGDVISKVQDFANSSNLGDEQKAMLNNYLTKFKDSPDLERQILEANKVVDSIMAQQTSVEQAKLAEQRNVQKEHWAQIAEMGISAYSEISSAVSNFSQLSQLEYEIQAKKIEDVYTKALKSIDNQVRSNMISEDTAYRQREVAEAEKERKLKEAFEKTKGLKKAEIWMNAASAIMGTWASMASLGPIGWGIASVQTGVLAGIASKQSELVDMQSFATGGFPKGKNAIIQVNENGQEAVLNARATSALGPATINAFNRGDYSGASSKTTSNSITYSPVITFQGGERREDLISVLSDDKKRFAELISETSQRGYKG
jgi:TP901 family phage tail tape measure protein